MNKITIHYELDDGGYHLFTSPDLPGLHIGSSDGAKAAADLPKAIEILQKANGNELALRNAVNAEIVDAFWGHIDRMKDYCEVDSAERIIDSFLAEISPAIAALDSGRS